jgi:hypothetical protein
LELRRSVPIVIDLARVPAARAAGLQALLRIEGIVEGGHETSCQGVAPQLSKAHASPLLRQLR